MEGFMSELEVLLLFKYRVVGIEFTHFYFKQTSS